MHTSLIPLALLGAFLPVHLTGQQALRTYQVPNSTTQTRAVVADGVASSAVSRDAGRTWTRQGPVDTDLHIRYGTFDPRHPTVVPGDLVAGAGSRLFIVQFHTQIIPEFRARLQGMGAQIHHYLPSQSYLVRMDPSLRTEVEELAFVRCVASYELAYRLEPKIIAELGEGGTTATRYLIVLVDKRRDAAGLERRIVQEGGQLNLKADGGILLEATLTEKQLMQVVADDRVLWIQRHTPIEVDIDNARVQGGTAYLIGQRKGGTGKGINGHVCEGVYRTHPEFAARAPYRTAPVGVGDSGAQGHGNSTAGEIYARGVRTGYKGLMPFAQMFYTSYNYVINKTTRYPLTKTLVNTHKVMLSTASWGNPQITVYDARSAEMDDIIFDWDMFTTQSQSNTGSQRSRPQAWAKNICSVGGFNHRNNSNRADDYWGGGASIGPASDGRIGVTLAAYYDSINTTGYSATSYTTSFGGTSGATPIVNGHAGIVIETFTDGYFGYTPKASWDKRWAVMPHFTTVKSLLIATARQLIYDSSGRTKGANRYQQGWGFPSITMMWDQRDKMLVIDELDTLIQGQSRTYYMWVPPGSVRFVAAMNYSDPEAAANATIHRINSVDLAVEFGNGDKYWGNHGLLSAETSTKSATKRVNDRDTEECVNVAKPPAGYAAITVTATNVRKDGHVETPISDVDYGLVVRGIDGLRSRAGMTLDLGSTAVGNFTVSLKKLPTGYAHGFTLFSLNTSRPVSTGNLFGLELDGFTLSLLASPVAAGSVFHFPSTGAAVFPNTTYAFPGPLAVTLSGQTIDAVAIALDSKGDLLGASNVSRVSIK